MIEVIPALLYGSQFLFHVEYCHHVGPDKAPGPLPRQYASVHSPLAAALLATVGPMNMTRRDQRERRGEDNKENGNKEHEQTRGCFPPQFILIGTINF